MLRTMISEAPFEERWSLHGRLRGQWALDLKRVWENHRQSRGGRRCVVDLENVISVDPTGQSALLEMDMDGAWLTASRAYMKHKIEEMQAELAAWRSERS